MADSASVSPVASVASGPPRRPARPPDYGKLQALLKREMLLINSDRSAVKDVYDNIQALVEELLLLSWNTQQLGRKVDLLFNNKLSLEHWGEFETEDTTKGKFANAYSKFGTRAPVFEKFLSILWDNPLLLAKPLANPKIVKDLGVDVDEVISSIFFGLYGNFFTPKEDQSVLRIIEHILIRSYETNDSPQSWLRENTIFSRMFTLFAKNYSTGRQYLKAALQEPVMAVLEDDLLNLEIDPVKVYQALSGRDRLQAGFSEMVSDYATLTDHPVMKQMLANIYPKIANFCKFFLKSLTDKLPCLPFGVRWLCRQIVRCAIAKGASTAEACAQMGDLLLWRFVTPAIIYPEPHGIITDTPVSIQARRNLTLIVKVLRALVRGTKGFSQREQFMTPLQDKVADVNLEAFFTAVQNVGDLTDGLPSSEEVDVGRKVEVVSTIKSIVLFQNLLRQSESFQEQELSPEIKSCLEKMKAVQLDPTDDDLMLINVNDEQSVFSILSEADILNAQKDSGGGGGNGGGPAPVVTQDVNLNEVKKQLRVILSNMDLTRSWKGGTVIDILRSEAMEANLAETRGSMAQIAEAIRLLRALPEQCKVNNFNAVNEEMLKDFNNRAVYSRYLVKLRQDLLLTQDQLRIHRDRVLRSKQLYHQYYKTMQINNFIEKRETEIVSFVERFNDTDMLDERAAFTRRFLQQSMDALTLHKIWKNASPEERTEANLVMEKYFMCRIYSSAFNPNGVLDREKDLLFSKHIGEINKFITLEHETLQINPRFRSQAPWPLAQRALLKINVYKGPGDKLQCIVECCQTIMNLITLNGTEAGADDFFPVLVFVIVQASPPNLLSTVQYIKYFYESRALGEAMYWWSQFVFAIEFIKTMNPHVRGPPSK